MTRDAATSYPKDQIKVLLLENIHASASEIFGAEHFQIEKVKGALKPAELAAKIADVHILGIRSKTHVTAEVLANAKRLLTLGCFCIGTNQVDLEAANRRGVPVFNAPFSNTRSVAELVISEVVALARQLGDRSREVHEGTWKKTADGSHEIRGKTLGIVGYGHIGSQVGVLAEAMGMRVVFFDVMTKLPMGNNKSLPTLDELLKVSDFVTLHVPATPQTKMMISAPQLALMKRGAHLLNNSRGSVVDIDALAAAIKEGRVGGAAVDVFPEEPEGNGAGFQSALRGLPNVILTPHIGGSTEEAQEAIGYEVATSLTKFTNTGTTTGTVNFPAVELPLIPGTHRILNVHKNVPGVLRDVNKIIADLNANIVGQVLATDANIGYLVMDVAKDVSIEVRDAISKLDTNIKTRILF
ncbi:MAG: phosphoglycerate dehydrogenase [Deltaproteobacteria bacterium]|nr:phosphoglycerate dehydrogenase [Deltaproteobacteria bacterium]